MPGSQDRNGGCDEVATIVWNVSRELQRITSFTPAIAEPVTNIAYRKSLSGLGLDCFGARATADALRPGAWDALP